jgi:hypothetical protein
VSRDRGLRRRQRAQTSAEAKGRRRQQRFVGANRSCHRVRRRRRCRRASTVGGNATRWHHVRSWGRRDGPAISERPRLTPRCWPRRGVVATQPRSSLPGRHSTTSYARQRMARVPDSTQEFAARTGCMVAAVTLGASSVCALAPVRHVRRPPRTGPPVPGTVPSAGLCGRTIGG